MPMYWHFYVETRADDGWVVPPDLPPRERYSVSGGELSWMHNKDRAQYFFFGEAALFPFARGRPPGLSEFCQRHDACYGTRLEWGAEFDVHWIGGEQLCLGLWDDPSILVGSTAPKLWASLFGDGTGSFPEQNLRAAGANGQQVSEILDGAELAHEPHDQSPSFRDYQHNYKALPPWTHCAVTWRTSVASMLPTCAADFRRLARYGSASDWRVISMLG